MTRREPRVSTHADNIIRKRLLTQAKQQNKPCAICGQPINYTTKDFNHPDAPTVDHIRSWRDHPELRRDLGNLQIAHRSCNTSKGVRTQDQTIPKIGNTSRNWNA